jgi:hypothetical protein
MPPSPSEKLAASLEKLQRLQKKGRAAIRSIDLSRADRERLIRNGFLQEIMKGWYIAVRPDKETGESTTWYVSFWSFCRDYLQARFSHNWCLSPEQSLQLQVGNRTVPSQLIVRSPSGTNNITKLPQGTSLLDTRQSIPPASDIGQQDGMNVFSIPAALSACSSNFFRQNPTDIRAALSTIISASDILPHLLESGRSIIAGRLAGAFRNIGKQQIADDILNTMRATGYTCREEDPFQSPTPALFHNRETSPYVNRMRLMWEKMREPILDCFPPPPGLPKSPKKIDSYLKHVDEISSTDAYHSLSIEGFRVSAELIEQVKRNSWRPQASMQDHEQLNALTARGYYLAFKLVRQSLRRVLTKHDPATVASNDHMSWYRELFAPLVAAHLLRTVDLAGYRHEQVFIRQSKHVPPRWEAVRDLMPGFFDLLGEEKEAAVRVVLGHFIFVYIHPYMDGNGRMGRFLMNVMLASGGYPWTVIPVTRKRDYLNSLELASVNQNIKPFAKFLATLVKENMAGFETSLPTSILR